MTIIADTSTTVLARLHATSLSLLLLIDRPVAVVVATSLAVTEGWGMVNSEFARHSTLPRTRSECGGSYSQQDGDNSPASLPVTRPPRLPRAPAPPPRGAVGASLGASRLPSRGAGFSTTFGGGDGSLSESSSGSLPAKYSEEADGLDDDVIVIMAPRARKRGKEG